MHPRVRVAEKIATQVEKLEAILSTRENTEKVTEVKRMQPAPEWIKQSAD